MLSAVPWGCKQDRGHLLISTMMTGFAGHWLACLVFSCCLHVKQCVHAAGGAVLPTCDRV